MDKLLRKCTCGKFLSQDQAPYLGTSMEMYWFNCPFCRTTFVVPTKSPNGEAFAEYMKAATAGIQRPASVERTT